MDRRIEVAEALPPELPQPRRVPRGLHRPDRQGSCWLAQASLVPNRRLLVPARRHADRRVLAERQTARGGLAPRSRRRALSRPRLTGPQLPLKPRDSIATSETLG